MTFLAFLETENFTFVAAGKTRKLAAEAMVEGWHVHLEQHEICDTALVSFTDLEVRYGVSILELRNGQCVRDKNDVLPRRKTDYLEQEQAEWNRRP